jgi:hypothetical protein
MPRISQLPSGTAVGFVAVVDGGQTKRVQLGTMALQAASAYGPLNVANNWGATQTVAGSIIASQGISCSTVMLVDRPSDHWTTVSTYRIGSGTSRLGQLDTHGSNGVALTSNGYRNNAGSWTGFGAGGSAGAAQIELLPTGLINFRLDATKANGSGFYPTTRVQISESGIDAIAYMVAGNQVLGPRRTGWSAQTGTATRTTYATYAAPTIGASYSQSQVQAIADALQRVDRRMKALTDDLISHGSIGA